MIRIFYFLYVPCLFASLNSGTVSLVNDSPFPLVAEVQSQGGIFLAQEMVQPGQQRNLITSNASTEFKTPNGSYNTPMTPYTVIWKCADGGYYSMCTDVSPGALVRANYCPGVRSCHPKGKEDQPPHPKSRSRRG